MPTVPRSDEEPSGQPPPKCGRLILKRRLRLPRSCVARGGVVPQLLATRSRWALPVWLLMVAAADPNTGTVDVGYYDNFARRSLGLDRLKPGSRRSVVARALDALENRRLVAVTQRRGHVLVELLALDGSGRPYAMPAREEKVIYLPGVLFAQGWHLELSVPALGALLISLCEEAWQYRKLEAHQWAKSRYAVTKDYGIAESTWSKGKAELFSWGLLDWRISDRDGSRKVPSDLYTVDVSVLTGDPDHTERYVALPIQTPYHVPGTGTRLSLPDHVRHSLPPRGAVDESPEPELAQVHPLPVRNRGTGQRRPPRSERRST